MNPREFQAKLRGFQLNCVTAGLCVVFAGLAYDGLEEQQHNRNPMMADAEKAKKELWTISVASTAIKIHAFPDPSHNCILIRNPQGEVVYSMHGFAADPKTGRYVGVGGDSNVLRCAISKEMGNFKNAQIKVETDVFCGTLDELVPKIERAAHAMLYINEQNFSYIATDGIISQIEAQNSNSLTKAMLQIMGLSTPEENQKVWAPGKNRDLLLHPPCIESIKITPTIYSLDVLYTLTMLNAMEKVPDRANRLLLSDAPDYIPVNGGRSFAEIYSEAYSLVIMNEESNRIKYTNTATMLNSNPTLKMD